MSLFMVTQTQIKDRDVLVEALVDMGFAREQIQVHQTAQPLYGYRGDQRPERAEVIIPRRYIGSYSNDIGFARQPDGTYLAIISEYDRGNQYSQSWIEQLLVKYGEKVTLKHAKAGKYKITSRKINNGVITMVLER